MYTDLRLYYKLDFITLCPCGMFCGDCLIESIQAEGIIGGIFWHIVLHSPLGHIWAWTEIKR
jgi:hypothetical protein